MIRADFSAANKTSRGISLLCRCIALFLLALPITGLVGQSVLAQTSTREVIQGYLRLGDIYSRSDAGFRDLEKAFQYYKLADQAGSMTARLRVGEMLISGEGVNKDVDQGLKLVKEVAAEGRVAAYSFLGRFYSEPSSSRRDLGRAMEYFSKAAEKGDNDTLLKLGAMYRSGDLFKADPQKAFEYYSKAENAGSASAAIEIGIMMVLGEGTERNVEEGMRRIREMADTGKTNALLAEGDLLLRGESGKMDVAGAVQAYEKAASMGSVSALLRLGDLYFYNNFNMRNLSRAISYYRQAADGDDIYGIYALGKALAASPKTAAEGLALLTKAESAGNESATVAIANSYFFGTGVRADIKKGLALLEEAAASGNQEAAKRLLRNYRDGLKDGRRYLIRPNQKQARAVFAKLKPKLGLADVAYENILLEATASRTGKADQYFAKIMELPVKTRQKLVRDLRPVNENDYVEVLQLQMKSLGLFTGNDSGLLDSGTIRAINNYCQEKSASVQCRGGPVSYQAAEILSGMF